MKKGFTLIELLVVIAIIAIISTLISASLNKAFEEDQDNQIISPDKVVPQ